jgi:hypothetical protein
MMRENVRRPGTLDCAASGAVALQQSRFAFAVDSLSFCRPFPPFRSLPQKHIFTLRTGIFAARRTQKRLAYGERLRVFKEIFVQISAVSQFVYIFIP